MSRSYLFIDKSTNKNVTLAGVEREMVAILDNNYKIREDKYHPVWDMFLMNAFGRLMRLGGYRLEPHMWVYIADQMSADQTDPDNAVRIKAMVLYLQSKYHFEAYG